MLKQVKFGNYYDEITKSKLPVIVEFYAPWCEHCAEVTPRLEALSSEYEGKVKFCQIDTEEEELLTIKNKIKGLPTVVFINDEEELFRFNGEKSSEDLKALLHSTFSL